MKKFLLLFIVLLFPAVVCAATSTSSAQPVQYDLPYPGMLPNSPLYFLKQTRDWILDKLIVDPVKKTEFYILQGDKRLVMGGQLLNSGSGALGEQTISKGEKYMNNAVTTLLSFKAQGTAVPAYLIDHMTKSLAKHEEVLNGQVAKMTDATVKSGLTGSLDLVHMLQSELLKLQ